MKSSVQSKLKSLISYSRFSLFLISVTLLFWLFMGESAQVNADQNSDLQPYKLPELSSPLSRRVQGIFGINRLAAWIGSKQLKKEIHKKVEGDIDIKIKPYSALDLKEGKARALTVEGNNLLYDNSFYVSSFHLQTDEDTPIWIDLDSGKFKSPLEADVTIRITENDINKSFATERLRNQLENIRVPLLGKQEQTIRLLNPVVEFKPERLRLQSRLGIKGTENTIPLNIETGLEPGNLAPSPPMGERVGVRGTLIRLKDVRIDPIPGLTNSAVFEDLLTNSLQWILKPSKLLPFEGSKVEVKSLQISDKDILLEGHVWIPSS